MNEDEIASLKRFALFIRDAELALDQITLARWRIRLRNKLSVPVCSHCYGGVFVSPMPTAAVGKVIVLPLCELCDHGLAVELGGAG